MSARYDGKPCKNCGSTERYIKQNTCCACQAVRVRKRRGGSVRGPNHHLKAAPKAVAVTLPVAGSDFIKPLTRQQLMAGR